MSGIIHIGARSRPGRVAVLTLCAAAPVAALLWWLAGDGEPLPHTAVPFSPMAASADKEYGPEPAQSLDPASEPALAGPPAPFAKSRNEAVDVATRNANVDLRLLTASRPNAALAFLNEVQLTNGPQGGYVVAEVLPESRYERLGLLPGDVIYSLDTPKMAAIDETSMIALTQQTEIELDVYRNGTLTRLSYNYANPQGADRDARP